MSHLIKQFTLYAILFLLVITAGNVFASRISVGTVSAAPGQQAIVPVYLNENTIEIASLSIPLKYTSDDIQVDSISFGGSLLASNMHAVSHIDNVNNFVRITYVPSIGDISVITAQSGLLGHIFFSISPTASEQVIILDSINDVEYSGSLEKWIRVELADASGKSVFLPEFSEGNIEVSSPLGADDGFSGLPGKLELNQNYPNPFNPSTTISYSVPERGHISLKVYNILGQEIKQLVDEVKSVGQYEVNWESGKNASGIYFYRLAYQNEVLTKKMTLLK